MSYLIPRSLTRGVCRACDAKPRHAPPSRAKPCHALPRLPRPATPGRALPRQAMPAMPGLAEPDHALPRLRCLALPSLAGPGLAEPRLRCLAVPCHASPGLRCPDSPHHAGPSLACVEVQTHPTECAAGCIVAVAKFMLFVSQGECSPAHAARVFAVGSPFTDTDLLPYSLEQVCNIGGCKLV